MRKRGVILFCSGCGSRISDGSLICGVCGMAQGQTVNQQSNQEYLIQKNAVRQNEMIALDKAIKYFSLKQRQFSDYDVACDGINYHVQKRGLGMFITGLLLLLAGLLIFCYLFRMTNVYKDYAELLEDEMLFLVGKASVYLYLIICLIFVILPGFVLTVVGVLIKNSRLKQKNSFEEMYIDLSQELYMHFRSYLSCPVEAAYCNPQILKKLMYIIQSGNADTVGEALNTAVYQVEPAFWDYMNQTKANTAEINTDIEVDVIFAPAKFFK